MVSPKHGRVGTEEGGPTYAISKVLVDAFWSKVRKRPQREDGTDGCWQWLGALHTRGYGRFIIRSGGKQHTVLSHRFSWEQLRGPIAPDYVLVMGDRVLCNNRGCIQPSHWQQVLKTMARKVSKTRYDREVQEEFDDALVHRQLSAIALQVGDAAAEEDRRLRRDTANAVERMHKTLQQLLDRVVSSTDEQKRALADQKLSVADLAALVKSSLASAPKPKASDPPEGNGAVWMARTSALKRARPIIDAYLRAGGEFDGTDAAADWLVDAFARFHHGGGYAHVDASMPAFEDAVRRHDLRTLVDLASHLEIAQHSPTGIAQL